VRRRASPAQSDVLKTRRGGLTTSVSESVSRRGERSRRLARSSRWRDATGRTAASCRNESSTGRAEESSSLHPVFRHLPMPNQPDTPPEGMARSRCTSGSNAAGRPARTARSAPRNADRGRTSRIGRGGRGGNSRASDALRHYGFWPSLPQIARPRAVAGLILEKNSSTVLASQLAEPLSSRSVAFSSDSGVAMPWDDSDARHVGLVIPSIHPEIGRARRAARSSLCSGLRFEGWRL